MKRFFPLLFLSTSLWGMYCGNPLSPQLPEDGIKAAREEPFQLRFGYLGDFLLYTAISDDGDCSGNFQLCNLGGVINRRVNIELMAGGSSFHLVLNNEQQTKIYASGWPAYGARIQAIVKRWGKVFMGLNAGGMYASSQVRSQTIQGVPTEKFSDTLRVKTWQLGLAFGRKNEFLSPYIGFKIGDLLGKVGPEKFKMEHRAGLYVGCSIVPYAIMAINLEARFIDEQSGTIEAYVGF